MKKGQLPKRRRSGEGAVGQVSLFPFMAVLLCTMGVLILLLIIIAKTARDRALQAQRAQLSSIVFVEDACFESLNEALKTLNEEFENSEWIAAGMREAGEIDILEAKKFRDRLAVEEEIIRKLKEEAEDLRNALRELLERKDGSGLELAELEKMIAKKEDELKSKLEELEKLKLSPKEKKKAYAIVPFNGRNNTRRYPVYIVCNRDSIEILPEGIKLLPIDFAATGIQRGAHLNPLDSAIRAATLYLRETGKIGPEEEAYPLLLARPSGVETYALAWHFLAHSGNDFGYELVEEDLELVYPKPSEEMKQRMSVQVERTRGEIVDLFTILSREGGGRGEGALHRFGGGAAYSRIEEGEANKLVYGTHDPRTSRGQAEIAREIRQNGDSGGIGNGGEGLSPSGGGTETAFNPQGIENGNLSGNGFIIPNPISTEIGMPYGGRAGGGQSGTFAQHEPASNGETRQPGGNPSDPGQGFAIRNPDEMRAENPTATTTVQPGRYPQNIQPGTPVEGGSTYPPYQSYQKNQPGQVAGNAQPARGTTQSGEVGGNQDGGSMNPSAAGTVSGFSGGRGSLGEPGDNWAVKGYEFRAIEIRRSVKIRIEPNRLVLLKQAGLFGDQTVKIENSFRDAGLEFASKVIDYTENWGSAGENRYWRPVLKVKIAPGAENRYEEFKKVMQNSGLVIEKDE